MNQKIIKLTKYQRWIKSIVGIFTRPTDVGNCMKCRYNVGDNCFVGMHYAKQGKSKFCINGELWETKHNENKIKKL